MSNKKKARAGIARGSARDVPITIGCDPEFTIIDRRDNLVDASSVFDGGTHGQIGYDGRSDTGELRPEENTDPIALANTINMLIVEAARSLKPTWTVLGGSFHSGAPIGGHIHIGHRCLNSGPDLRDFREELGRCLDYFVSLPLLFMEDQNSAIERRNNCGYGSLSSIRGTAWGIEYRTPPSWLVARRYTKAALCLAYMTAWEYLFVRREISFGKTTQLQLSEHRRQFIDCEKGELKQLVLEAKKELRTFQLWPRFGLHTQPIWENLSQDRTWRCDWNLLRRWPIEQFREEVAVLPSHSGDWQCAEIANLLNEPSIHIYGLSGSLLRPGVAYSGEGLQRPECVGIPIEEHNYSSVAGSSIGLSRSLRNNINACVTLCRNIIHREPIHPVHLIGRE